MSSSFGTLLRSTTFGESHCAGVGAVLDGCPPGMALSEADIQAQLDRRRPGQSELSSPRQEADQVQILSGVEGGVTLGTPIGLLVRNKDHRPGDYAAMRAIPRPSHADFTYQAKYGVRASSGGGRSSARETIGRVACGAIAEKFLREAYGAEIVAWVSAVGEIEVEGGWTDALRGEDGGAARVNPLTLTRDEVDRAITRCPDPDASARMERLISQVRDDHDSVGGVVSCVGRGIPAGWGEPVFEKLEALLAQAMLSIPATKGFESGSGFPGTQMRGSAHNDTFVKSNDSLSTRSNFSGGVQGGISNGAPLLFRVAFKPPATIGLPQETVNFEGERVTLEAKGRHDPCVVPRAVPIVEAMAALVLGDLALRQRARLGGDG